jgi:hypothetical protein
MDLQTEEVVDWVRATIGRLKGEKEAKVRFPDLL